MCLIGLPKLLAGATNIPTWGTGLTVPPSSAWAAIGKYGVAVEGIVAVSLGGGVVANTVGELLTGAAARVGL